MTNRELAELRDPERRQAGWWLEHQWCNKCGRDHLSLHITPGCPYTNPSSYSFTGPDWHASDDACFRDWRPVLLVAGCDIWHHEKRTCVCYGPKNIAVTEWEVLACSTLNPDGEGHYRAAILATVAWLAEHKPALLREAIARVVEGK